MLWRPPPGFKTGAPNRGRVDTQKPTGRGAKAAGGKKHAAPLPIPESQPKFAASPIEAKKFN